MFFYNKVILLANLNELNELLINDDHSCLYNCYCKPIYANRIAIEHTLKQNRNVVRIWRTNSLLDYWFDDFIHAGKNFVGELDYTIHSTYIKIDHLCINDSEMKNVYNNPLDEYDSEDLMKSFIRLIKRIAISKQKDKIIIDVHPNLRLYEKYYHYNGFDITNRTCEDNPYWMEAEMNLTEVTDEMK